MKNLVDPLLIFNGEWAKKAQCCNKKIKKRISLNSIMKLTATAVSIFRSPPPPTAVLALALGGGERFLDFNDFCKILMISENCLRLILALTLKNF